MTRPRKTNRHLPAKMYFKHGRHWYVSGGRWTKLSADYAEALAEYGRIVSTPQGSMDALIDRVLASISPTLSESTNDQYATAGRMLKKAFAEFAPEQVKGKHVAALKQQLAATPNMANRVLSVLRIIFSHAVEWQMIDSNPCIGVARLAENKRDRYITDDEWTRIRAQAHPRLAAIMDLQYLTGQRIGDVIGIRRTNITEDGIYFEQKKTGAKVLVEMTHELRQAIERAKKVDGENVRGLTLFHIRGRVPSYYGVRDLFNAAALRAGVKDARPNDTRAKAITDSEVQGGNSQALGGHATKAMTQRYIRQRITTVAQSPSFGQSNRQRGKKS